MRTGRPREPESWRELAERFTFRTGVRMNPRVAQVTHDRALAKIRAALERDPEVMAYLGHPPKELPPPVLVEVVIV